MPDVVEIYMCKAGQKLDQGQMVVSHDITDKEAAKADAESRCKINPTLARVAYYAINPNGDFKPYYAYANPNIDATKPKAESPARKRKKKKKPVKMGVWQKVKVKLGL